MKFKIYKLHFTAPLHLGDMRDDYSVSLQTIASDTMYAALTSTLAKINKEMIPDGGDLGCTISSLFPFYQKVMDKTQKDKNDAILFFPKPLKQTLPKLDDLTKAKSVKKVSWLDVSYFKKALNGENLFATDDDINNVKGEFLTSAKDFDKDFISSDVSPRVTVSRNGQEDAVPFYMDKIYFKEKSGLYFIACGDCSLIEKALKLLQHEGIGTDRNIGNGYFEYKPAELEIDIPSSADYAMSLSTFIPESKEQLQGMLADDNVAYDFMRRGGWITTPPHNTYRKNVVYAFNAASVFSMKIEGVTAMGKIVDLKPELDFEPRIDHSIYRCGKSLFLPIKL